MLVRLVCVFVSWTLGSRLFLVGINVIYIYSVMGLFVCECFFFVIFGYLDFSLFLLLLLFCLFLIVVVLRLGFCCVLFGVSWVVLMYAWFFVWCVFEVMGGYVGSIGFIVFRLGRIRSFCMCSVTIFFCVCGLICVGWFCSLFFFREFVV